MACGEGGRKKTKNVAVREEGSVGGSIKECQRRRRSAASSLRRRMANKKGALFVLALFLVIHRAPLDALKFIVPKEGHSYDTSEMVYYFEREAHEEGYPVLEVDGGVVQAFDFMQFEYELSMMGQQVGQHTAVVRLLEFPLDSEEAAAHGNRELANVSVTFSIAEPGSGINFMRSSLVETNSPDSDEAYARGEALITSALQALRATRPDPNPEVKHEHEEEGGDKDASVRQERAREQLREAAVLVRQIRRRRYTAQLVMAILEAADLGLPLHELFSQEDADPFSHYRTRTTNAGVGGGGAAAAATADVLASKDAHEEACPNRGGHLLHDFFQRIHQSDPYADFDSDGLEYSAGEHQGHDQGLMAALIHVIAPQLIIEVGSWKGGSAIQMASVLRRRGWGCRTKILCVDTWLGTSTDLKAKRRAVKNGYPTVYREFVHNILSAGLASVVIPLPAPANIAAKFLGHLLDKSEMPLVDLVFIDGNHDYDDVRADIQHYFPMLAPGGIMFGDDFGWAGVKKAVHEFAYRHNLSVISPGGRTWMLA